MRLALLPALIVFGLTIIISLVTGNPEDLFLALSTSSVLAKFMLATPVLMIPICNSASDPDLCWKDKE